MTWNADSGLARNVCGFYTSKIDGKEQMSENLTPVPMDTRSIGDSFARGDKLSCFLRQVMSFKLVVKGAATNA
jgi:hypothetical protein